MAERQVAVRAVFDAINVEAFWNAYVLEFWGDWIDDAVEDLAGDHPDVDRDDVDPYIDDASEGDLDECPSMPRSLVDLAIDEVLKRIAADQ